MSTGRTVRLTASLFTGEPWVVASTLAVLYYLQHKPQRQPLSHANACQLPLHRGAKGIDFTLAGLLNKGAKGVDFTLAVLFHRSAKGADVTLAGLFAGLLRRCAKLQTQLGTYNDITLCSFCRARTPRSDAFRSFPPHIHSPGGKQFRCHPKVRGSHLHRRCFQAPNMHCGSASV